MGASTTLAKRRFEPTRTTRNRGPRIFGIPAGLLLVCLLAVAVVVLPVVVTVIQALQGGIPAARRAIEETSGKELLMHTVLLAAVATPSPACSASPCAWFVERTRLPGRRLWALLLVAPLTVPLFVTSYAWATLGQPLAGVRRAPPGIIAFSYYPIIFLLVAVALRGLGSGAGRDAPARSGSMDAKPSFGSSYRNSVPRCSASLLLVGLDTLVEFDAFVALQVPNVLVGYLRSVPARLQRRRRSSARRSFSIVICLVLLFGEALPAG